MKRMLGRHLPDPDRLRQSRWFRLLGTSLLQPSLWHLNRHTAPGAVAIGMFCGLIPGPFQMLGSALLCLIFRVNLPLALVTTLYTNPFTIVPLYLLAFTMGTWMVPSNKGFVAPPDFDLGHMSQSLTAWANWTWGLGEPLAIGLVTLACTLAVIAYLAIALAWRYWVIREWKKRKITRKRLNTIDNDSHLH